MLTEELLDLLATMKQHAERERNAVRYLDARTLFDLATEGETLAQKLGQLLSRASREALGAKHWSEVCVRASEVRAIARANAELMRRSLDVIRAVRAPMLSFSRDDAPAFVSRVA